MIPYGSVMGERASLAGLNLVGLKRRGFDRDAIHALRNAYKCLLKKIRGRWPNAARRWRREFGGSEQVTEILAFMQDRGSRSLCVPKAVQTA